MRRDLLDLGVGERQTQLLDPGLDRIPSGQAVGDVDVPVEPEVGRIEYLVARGIVEDGLRVDAGLVGEGGVAGDAVVERHVDLDQRGDVVLDLAQQRQIVARADAHGILDVEARHQAPERRDAVPFADPQHRGVDMSGARLEGAEGVGHRATGVVVAVKLDVAIHFLPQAPHQVMDLAGAGHADGVRHAHTVHTCRVHGPVGADQVAALAAEGVLGAEADLDIVRADVLDNLDRRFDHLVHALAVRVLPQMAGGPDDDIDAVDTGLERQLRVAHVTARMSQHLGPQAQARHPFAVVPAATARRRRGELEVLDAERVQEARDLDFLVAVEEGVGELLAFAQGRFDDRRVGAHGCGLQIQQGRRIPELDGRPEKGLCVGQLGGTHPVLQPGLHAVLQPRLRARPLEPPDRRRRDP